MKKETLEEAAEKYARNQCEDMFDDIAPSGGSWGWETSSDFIAGAKWQAKRMYSEEDMQEYAEFCIRCDREGLPCIVVKDWFEQFKKK
jgi:hypothetical protein